MLVDLQIRVSMGTLRSLCLCTYGFEDQWAQLASLEVLVVRGLESQWVQLAVFVVRGLEDQ